MHVSAEFAEATELRTRFTPYVHAVCIGDRLLKTIAINQMMIMGDLFYWKLIIQESQKRKKKAPLQAQGCHRRGTLSSQYFRHRLPLSFHQWQQRRLLDSESVYEKTFFFFNSLNTSVSFQKRTFTKKKERAAEHTATH